ncbi:F-box only protein 13-like [Lolium rigidum]|uniref:F-box only protein 13-like n=1 Tax=Lolium rigidum TaxID=89674 RepID=UPI001F5C52AF|nr:F-box only protein 13-like [Lolium rigidum]
MLERVLARLPPASFFRLRGVSRRWRDAAGSPAFLAACARVPACDPWFLMLSDSDRQDARPGHAVAFDAGEGSWARCRGPPGPVPVAAAGGLVLYRAPDTVANPLTGASRALPPPPPAPLQAVAMYGSPYRVVLILGKLTDLSMSAFDPSTNSWSVPVPLSRKPDPDSPADANTPAPRGNNDDNDVDADADEDDGTVFFLTKSGTVMSSTTQRSPSQEHSCAVTCHPNSSKFLSDSSLKKSEAEETGRK